MKEPRTLKPAQRIWHIVDKDGWPYPGGPYTTRRAACWASRGEFDEGDRVVAYVVQEREPRTTQARAKS